MRTVSGHRRILFGAALPLMALGSGTAIGSERGWEARDRIAAFSEQDAFVSYVDTGSKSAASRSFRAWYWRGPCMLYWSGDQGEGGMIPMGRFKSAEIDPEGRLQFLGQREPEYLILAAHLSEDERKELAEAMTTIFEECHGPD